MPDQASAVETVTQILRRAAADGEITPDIAEWSIGRLGVNPASLTTKSTSRREDIILAATEVFRERGYHGATLDDVAERLSLSKPTLYHYFSGKQEILEAICDDAMNRADEAIRTGLGTTDNHVERLRAALIGYCLVLAANPSLSVAIGHFADLDREAQRRQGARRKAIEHMLAEALEAGVRDRVFVAPEPVVTTFGILGALNWQYIWFQPGGRLTAQDVAELLVSFLLDGLVAEPTQ